jgi:hypothetical protein
MVYSEAEHVLILELYFTSKLFGAVGEACSMCIQERNYKVRQQYTDG